MKIKTMEVYFCDHCNKLYQRRHACEKHEKYCGRNPLNRHKCFEFCGNLERLRLTEEGEYSDFEYTQFRCSATGKTMWSYIAEARGLHGSVSCECDERMPLECISYDGPPDFL